MNNGWFSVGDWERKKSATRKKEMREKKKMHGIKNCFSASIYDLCYLLWWNEWILVVCVFCKEVSAAHTIHLFYTYTALEFFHSDAVLYLLHSFYRKKKKKMDFVNSWKEFFTFTDNFSITYWTQIAFMKFIS